MSTLGSQLEPLFGESTGPSGGRLPDALQDRLVLKVTTGLYWIEVFCFRLCHRDVTGVTEENKSAPASVTSSMKETVPHPRGSQPS